MKQLNKLQCLLVCLSVSVVTSILFLNLWANIIELTNLSHTRPLGIRATVQPFWLTSTLNQGSHNQTQLTLRGQVCQLRSNLQNLGLGIRKDSIETSCNNLEKID